MSVPNSLRNVVFAAMAMVMAAVPAVAQPAATPAQPPILGVPVDVNYVLGLGDVIDVSLIGRTDYTGRARIGPDGTIQLPLIGRLQAANKTAPELSEDVRKALEAGKFYSQAAVRIDVIAVSSRYVTVLGQVGAPSLVPLDRAYRLSEILAKVGGRGSNGADYIIVTRADGKQAKFPVALIATGGPADDPAVEAGDKIYIPSLENEVFYVTGQVNSPGMFPLTPGLTVRMAIARGGGVTQMGNEKKVEINRDGKKVPKASLDSELQRGDIVRIGERLF